MICDICKATPAATTLAGNRTLCQEHMEARRDYGYVSGVLLTGEHDYARRVREWETRNPPSTRQTARGHEHVRVGGIGRCTICGEGEPEVWT